MVYETSHVQHPMKCVSVCKCMCVYSGVLPSALTQDNMCESLSIAHLSLFIATPHSESTQAQPAKGKTGQERGDRRGEGRKGWGGDRQRKRKGIEGRERGGNWKGER